MKKLLKSGAIVLAAVFLLASCRSKDTSGTTGWNYNDTKWGGFEKLQYEGQATGPNLVLVEGGTFAMGVTEEDVTRDWNNIPRVPLLAQSRVWRNLSRSHSRCTPRHLSMAG